MKKTLFAVAAAALIVMPLQAQRSIAYEGSVLAHYTKWDKLTTLDNGVGVGVGFDVYFLRRLSIGYSGDFASAKSARLGKSLNINNNRFDLVYNQPLTDKWRVLIGGGWTGTRFDGDNTKNQYDSGLNALLGLRYCVNDNWSWKAEGLADFKDPADQTPSFSKTTTYTLRAGITYFFGGQAKNGPCINDAAPALAPAAAPTFVPAPAPPPPQQQAAPPQQQQAAPPQQQAAPPPRREEPQPQRAVQQAPAPPAPRTFMPVHFAFNKSVLTAGARDTLGAVIDFMKANPSAKVEVVGYTDSIGTDAYNTRLGARRAMAVRGYLASKGIEAGRITTSTRGEADPTADNGTAEGRAKNRRAVVLEVR